MGKIITVEQFSALRGTIKDKVILTGGCFDILHIGHVIFFEELQKLNCKVVVLLESDQTVHKLKGKDRPIHAQAERAKILSYFPVDYILLMLPTISNESYYRLVKSIKPDIIASTEGDRLKEIKIDQAKKNNADFIEIPKYSSARSTSKIVKLLRQDL